MYLCKVKIVSFGVLELKMRNIERGFLLLIMICSLLFLFSCKNEEELITSFDWEGNWTVINSGDVQEDEEHNKPYTGTIKVKASNKDVIVMSGSLFGLLYGFCADDFSMKQKSLQIMERYGNYYVEW